MKLLKGSLVALVAILAVGLTVAMQAGAFETKAARVGECYFNAVVLDPASSCAQVTITRNVTNCEAVKALEDLPLFSLGASFTSQPEIDCLGGNDFCCLEIVANPTAICSQPQIDPAGSPTLARYRVAAETQIFCQP